MNLATIAVNVVDVAANGQAIAYAQRDTKADGSAFASFYLCDWGSLQSRPISEAAYLQVKFGEIGGYEYSFLVIEAVKLMKCLISITHILSHSTPYT